MRKKIERPQSFNIRLTTDERLMIRELRTEHLNISQMFREYLGFQYMNYLNKKNRR